MNNRVAFTVPFNSSNAKYRGTEKFRSTCYNSQGHYQYTCKRTPAMVALELTETVMRGGHTIETDQYGREVSRIIIDLKTCEVL